MDSFSLGEPAHRERPYPRFDAFPADSNLFSGSRARNCLPDNGRASEPQHLIVERIVNSDGLEALAPTWQALHDQITPRTPFTSPLWNILWWKHYQSRRFSVRDELCVQVVKDDRNRLIAVVPMMLTERPSKGPLRIRTLQCFGTDNNVTEIRGIVCKPEHQGQSLVALAKQLTGPTDSWDWIDWGVFRDDIGVRDTASLGSIHSDRQIIDYQLQMPATWEEFRSSRSRNIKESLRKCYNSLKRANLSARLQVVSTPDECPAALQTFFRLHAHRAHTAGTVVHPDVFRGDQDKEFLTEYALEMARRGQLRIFQLHVAEKIVAIRIAFLFDDELYLYYSGYDTEWGKFSVMTTLLAEALKWAITQKIAVVNLSTGADVSKLRWDPTPINFRTAIQVAPALHSRFAFAVYDRARRQPALSSLLGWIRR